MAIKLDMPAIETMTNGELRAEWNHLQQLIRDAEHERDEIIHLLRLLEDRAHDVRVRLAYGRPQAEKQYDRE